MRAKELALDVIKRLPEDATMHDLNDLIPASSRWKLSQGIGINDAGWIVGDGVGPNSGYDQAFLLTPVPVPEPASGVLAALGLVAALALYSARVIRPSRCLPSGR